MPNDDWLDDAIALKPRYNAELQREHSRNWMQMPLRLRQRAVAIIREALSEQELAEWEREIANNKGQFPTVHHHFAGMSFRNLLRTGTDTQPGIKDDELPSVEYNGWHHTNWDDYYAAVIEAAVRVRPMTSMVEHVRRIHSTVTIPDSVGPDDEIVVMHESISVEDILHDPKRVAQRFEIDYESFEHPLVTQIKSWGYRLADFVRRFRR